ncbi:MAG: 50S ribosomal protein L16 [Planctomycetota bacterium]|nr:50S ribosomal protein L16 [Planctomycetota bacterium]
MLMPKRVKYRKQQRGRLKGNAARGNTVAFGDYGIQALEHGWIPANVIEAGRVAAVRGAPDGRIYIRIFPHKSISSTPEETRMGTGKGEPDYWAAAVKPGTILYEVGGGVNEEQAKRTLNKVAHKMPIKCRFVRRRAKA